MVDTFRFLLHRKILIDSKFWLEIYVPSILSNLLRQCGLIQFLNFSIVYFSTNKLVLVPSVDSDLLRKSDSSFNHSKLKVSYSCISEDSLKARIIFNCFYRVKSVDTV